MSGIVNSTGARSGVIGTTVGSKVLQVISNSASDAYSGSGNDFSDQSVDTPSGTIQLASASNKVLIIFHLGSFSCGTDYIYFDFGRTCTGGLGTSTNVSGEPEGLGRVGIGSALVGYQMLHYMDAPGVAGTNIVYKLHYKNDDDSTSVLAGHANKKSTITLMEIAG